MDMILLQKMYDFRDNFVLECVHKENNAFRKDILNSWSLHKKLFLTFRRLMLSF